MRGIGATDSRTTLPGARLTAGDDCCSLPTHHSPSTALKVSKGIGQYCSVKAGNRGLLAVLAGDPTMPIRQFSFIALFSAINRTEYEKHVGWNLLEIS